MNKRILGIDPGYGRVGIAVIEKQKTGEVLKYSECFETEAKIPHGERLLLISLKISSVLKKWKPDELAIETLLFSKNVKTAIKVAEARGVIMVEAARKKVKIRELNPNQIKLAVTGYGKADKKQIISMLEMILKIKDKNSPAGRHGKRDDEYDAIATALASAVQLST